MLQTIIFLLLIQTLHKPFTHGAEIADYNAENIEGRIVNGEISPIWRYPFQLSLRYRSYINSAYAHRCGASILDSRTVITAAHCVYNTNAKDYVIVAGTNYRAESDGIIVRVQKIVVHEAYNASITDNDIALVFVEPELPLNGQTIAPIELIAQKPVDGVQATVSGWGTTTENGFSSTELQSAKLPIISNERCQVPYYWRPITNAMLCAGLSDGSRDACKGDSGGPLIVDGKLAGIVSWGLGCGRADYPGVYTNVVLFNDWITDSKRSVL